MKPTHLSQVCWVVERFDWDVLGTEDADLFEKETIGPFLKTVAT